MKASLILFGLMLVTVSLSARTWTSTSGSTIEAEMVSSNSMGVNLRRADGSELFVKFEQLSEADREFARGGGSEASEGGGYHLPENRQHWSKNAGCSSWKIISTVRPG